MDISAVNRIAQDLPTAATTIPPDNAAQNREVVQAVKAVNETEMFGQDTELQFQRDKATRRLVVQLVNRKTKEVLSQIPPEYVLRLAQDLPER